MMAWAVETLVATSMLMLAVLAVRMPVARFFGPHIAYGLWALPALRLLLPPLPEAVTPAPLQLLPSPIDIELLVATAPSATAEAATNWPLIAGMAWGVGALLFLGWHIHSYRRFVRRALGQATQLPRFDRDGVEVCASPAARGPFAAGIFLKTIILPEDYRRRYDRDELRLAIEHEVQHHRRWDMSANFAALVVLALHWWNPIAYFAHRAFRVDQELACDAVVLAHATPAERHAYGSALLKSACDRLPVAACALGAGDDLKRRLMMMKTYRRNPGRARLGGVIAAGLVGGGLLLTASNGIAAETTKTVEDKMLTAFAPAIPPTPPIPPVALRAPATPTAPKAPLAPVAPKPPATPGVDDDGDADTDGQQRAWVDHAAIAREVAAELRRELPRAQAEIRRAQAELRREMPRIQAERIGRAQAEAIGHTRAIAHACGTRSHNVSARIDGHGGKTVTCQGWSAGDHAELRKTMIVSLEGARAGIVSMTQDVLARDARERALEAVDRRLAELRAGK